MVVVVAMAVVVVAAEVVLVAVVEVVMVVVMVMRTDMIDTLRAELLLEGMIRLTG